MAPNIVWHNQKFNIIFNNTFNELFEDEYSEKHSWLLIAQENIHNRPMLIVFGIFLLSLIETIGNGSFLIIIIYEKYCMDPQKRTVNNQLLSALCKISILCNSVIFPIISLRVTFNVPLGMYPLRKSRDNYSFFTKVEFF